MENPNDGEYETAIAATAYAITKLEEEEDSLKQQKKVEGQTRMKSKLEEKTASFKWSFKWLSGTEAKETEQQAVSGNSILHKSVEIERAAKENYTSKYTNDREETDESLTLRKPPNLVKNNPNEKGAKRLQSDNESADGTKASSNRKPTGFSSDYKNLEKYPYDGKVEKEADMWEKMKMDNAKNRYEKMMSLISEWQIEKKTKARRRMEKKQGEPEHKRAKALQQYNDEVSRINKIVGDAQSLAKSRKQNDEMKIREKTAKIKSTGKLPGSYCNCC
ncbi:hypothetical protein KSP39_PZI002368 [Platanthera zijinensis]|uniref:Remorin C-terminal domain-containing protein n=1 Tax=Platanthera zijinensis TaxID=2320716 RepID=A0AAP0BYU3_9ASPA